MTQLICSLLVLRVTSYRFEEQPNPKRPKRDKGIGGGLQTYTKYVCEKLEQEREISNTEVVILFSLDFIRLLIC